MSGSPTLPPSSYASVPGGDVPLFKSGSTSVYATDVKDVVGSSSRNAAWELDGYSNYTNGSYSGAASGQTSYANAPFNGYTQGPGYYGKTFFLWPPDPRNGAITSASTVKSYLTAMGMNATDVTTLGNNWTTYQAQGMTTGLASLQSWLAWQYNEWRPYTTTSKFVTGAAATEDTRTTMQCAGSSTGVSGGPTAMGPIPCDWRNRFLNFSGSPNNTMLFNSSGSLDLPGSSTYTINYNAILSWIAQTPNPFPTQMRAGRIKYYGSIPTAITGIVAELRQHRSAILGRVDRPCTRLQANVVRAVTKTSARWPATAAISPGEP